MATLLEQLKKRRFFLGLKQKDMMLRIGVSRQQYQQIESKGNPRLKTLELIAKGLKSELMLIPIEKLELVKNILDSEINLYPLNQNKLDNQIEESSLENNPWKDIFKDTE